MISAVAFHDDNKRSGHVSFPGEERKPSSSSLHLHALTTTLLRFASPRLFFVSNPNQPLPKSSQRQHHSLFLLYPTTTTLFEQYSAMFFSRASLVTLALSAIGAKAVYFVPVNTTVTQVSPLVLYVSRSVPSTGPREIARLTVRIYSRIFFAPLSLCFAAHLGNTRRESYSAVLSR